MRNLLLTIQYCGTHYHGFQVQRNAITVCEVFQDAVESVLGTRYDVKGCSRTDSGVHAKEYCLSMAIAHTIPTERLGQALNSRLPDDIAVLNVREVSPDFHARYSCKAKQYVYCVYNSHIKNPFSPNLSYRFGYTLDEKMLHEQAQDFLGSHDFAAFCSQGSDIVDTVRRIYEFQVTRQGDYVLFTVTGDGFLYNMVRIMVGTLLFIATGKREKGSIPAILDSRDRSKAGKTMPACGLYLNKVFYEDL